jgi:hypothetical protein
VRTYVEIEHRSLSDGSMRRYDPSQVLPDGRNVMAHFREGHYAPGSDGLMSRWPENQPSSSKPPYPFGGDKSVRPWLFGNWWKLGEADPLQLIGLGVRFAHSPNIEDAEGNGRIKHFDNDDRVLIDYHGTFLRICTEDGMSDSFTCLFISLNVAPDAPLARIIPGRLRASDSASELSFSRIRNWIMLCDRDHHCTHSTAPLPTRVLDVCPNSQYIRLVETSGQHGTYITLSHCWGTSPMITTKTATLNARKREIALSDLPQTFLDAVRIVRRLDIRYLWIDSLCIIQDDPLDWEREASRMGPIYAWSYLTIAATSSVDSSGGCLPTWLSRSYTGEISPDATALGRSILVYAAPVLNNGRGSFNYYHKNPFVDIETTHEDQVSKLYIYTEWMPSSTKAKPTSYNTGAFGRKFDPVAQQPLNLRGWTLQERFLSPRTLHFDTTQMYWECREDFQAEDGSRLKNVSFSRDIIISREQLPLYEHGFGRQMGISLIEGDPAPMVQPWGRWAGGWLAVVEQYSRRKLTYEVDKLPALSGLASFIASRTGDEYYAGLWRDHILEDLHWRVYSRMEHRRQVPGGFEASYGEKLCDVITPAAYRAPSWSWASLDAFIKFIPLDFDRVRADLIQANVTPAGNDPFGKVAAGWIKLRVSLTLYLIFFRLTLSKGPLIEIHQADSGYKFDKTEPLGLGTLVEIHLNHDISMGEAYFDVQPHFPCFGLFLDPSNCLILKPTDKADSEYTRIGIAKFLRTQNQRAANPFTIWAPNKRDNVPFGPIDDVHVRSLVTIV